MRTNFVILPFALVEVMPDIQDDSGIEVRDDDVEWDFSAQADMAGRTSIKSQPQ